jgi:uncharacterized protein (UPF0276 family)
MRDLPSGATGVGINYKTEIRDDILEYIDHLDLIEINTEKFFIRDDDPVAREVRARIPVVLHGLDLSLGSTAPITAGYLANLRLVLEQVDHLWFSDHASLTEEGGTEVGHLMPVSFSEATVDVMVEKIRTVQSLSDRPFLLENITYYYPVPGADMGEARFYRDITSRADCGMLLDVNNLYINSVNHRYDPLAFLEQLPMDRVVEIHLAGGSRKFGMLVDTHATPVWDEVWNLFDEVCRRCRPRAVIVERDANFPEHRVMMDELDQARAILSRHGYRPTPATAIAV